MEIMTMPRRILLSPPAFLGLGVVILALLLLSIKNLLTLEAMNLENRQLYERELLPISHIKEANSSLFDVERNLKRLIIAQSPSQRAEARNSISNGEKSLKEEIAEAAKGMVKPENIQRISLVENLYAEYKRNVAHALDMMERENAQGENPIDYVLSEDFQKVVDSTDKLLDEIVAKKEADAIARQNKSQSLYLQSELLSLLILATTLAFGIVGYYLFRSALLRPLENLQAAVAELASGRLDIVVPHTGNQDVIGAMARSIQRMHEQFRSLTEKLVDQATQPPVAGRKPLPERIDLAESLLQQPAAYGSQTSPLSRSSHNYLNALGESLYLRGELGAAELPLRSALALIPDSLEALVNLAKAHYGRGQHQAAEACLRRSLNIYPFAEDALYLLSAVLANTSRPEAAEYCQRKLLAINPWHEGALLLMKHFLAQQGRFAEAEAFNKRAIRLNPQSPLAVLELANLRKMTLADSEWLHVAEELVATSLPGEEFQLRYAMGKFYDDTNQYDRAFACFHRANELAKAVANNPYRPEDWTRRIDRLIQANDPSCITQVRLGASPSDRPVFVVGMPRSGTTLVEQILASHPAVFGAGELGFWDAISKSTLNPAMEKTPHEDTLRALAEEYLNHLGQLNGEAARVVDKMPGNFRHLGLIHKTFPNAKIIHVQRDPIDTCLSIYFQNFSASYNYANDLDDLAHYYRGYRRLMAHWRALLPAEAFLELRYEDLLADQEGMSRNMIAFLGLEWNERCLSYYLTERRVATASKWQVRQKLYTSSRERWRNYAGHVAPLLVLQDLPA